MYKKIKNVFKNLLSKKENKSENSKRMNEETLRYIFSIVILLEIISFLLPSITVLNTKEGVATVLPSVLSMLVNEERKEESLSLLSENDLLNKAAMMKATDMARRGYFAHTSPEGKTPWYWLDRVQYRYEYAGENLAINFSESKDVTEAWMASPAHKENIIKEEYTEVGTGVVEGIYEGKRAIFIAQVYANPTSSSSYKALLAKEENEIVGQVLGSSVNTSEKIVWEKIFSSPNRDIDLVLYVFSGIVVFFLFVYTLGKMRNQRRGLVTNTIITIAIIGAIFSLNYYFNNSNTLITQTLHYSNPNLHL